MKRYSRQLRLVLIALFFLLTFVAPKALGQSIRPLMGLWVTPSNQVGRATWDGQKLSSASCQFYLEDEKLRMAFVYNWNSYTLTKEIYTVKIVKVNNSNQKSGELIATLISKNGRKSDPPAIERKINYNITNNSGREEIEIKMALPTKDQSGDSGQIFLSLRHY